ncbi:hypothetical protein GGI15_004417 [Coemansia interrupta]|uniref:Cytochrome P450 monooxygenase n=1 Tax=Coemansia interrupta TaxID=1126814 RepID=A0A9W8H6A2_9FUNG|nr:hypothetical protein GGI15_004417 [Coemansia interrupta]
MPIAHLVQGCIAQIAALVDASGIPRTTILAGALILYLSGLSFSRLFLSPLSRIPGSPLSKLTVFKLRLDALTGRMGRAAHADYYKYGDIYTLAPNIVVLSNPTDCRTILSTHRFAKSHMYEAFALIDDTMFTTRSVELVHVRRKQVGPAFTHGYLAEMEPTIVECGIEAIRSKWDKMIQEAGGVVAEINYARHFSLATFDIIGALGYGQRFNALQNDQAQIISWVNRYNSLAMLKFSFGNPESLPNRLFLRGLLRSKDEFVAFGNAAAQARRNMLAQRTQEKPKDILQALLDAEDPESKVSMTPLQITAENIGFLIAGTDTTSLTLSWTIHYLMLHPRVYAKAVTEVRSLYPSALEHTISYAEAKANLPYLEACIYESMRIQAVSGVPLPRIVPKGGATFQGYYLPEGTQLGVNIAGANHHKGTWDKPREFIPERFIRNEKLKQYVLTFSSGVRICPGRNLAHYEMMTILAIILRDYDLENPKDALFTPDNLDRHGNPHTMPCTQNLTIAPKYPDRDCRIIVRRAPKS